MRIPNEHERLRERALALIAEHDAPSSGAASLEREALIEELEVHSVELELQQDELRRALAELDRSRELYACSRELYERFRELYDDAPVGYLTLTRWGEVVATNTTAARLFGLERPELEGTPLPRLFDAEGADRLHLHLQRALVEPAEVEIELEAKGPWLRFESRPTEETKQGVPCCRSVVSDVRGHHSVEAQTERRLALLGRLVSKVTHEFNNLLMGMDGCVKEAELALDDAELEQARAALLALDGAVARGKGVTRRFLQVARERGEEPAQLELDAALLQSRQLLRARLGEAVELRIRPRTAGARVELPPGQLEQVLVNLVINAREAGAQGIEICTAPRELDEARARALGVRAGAYLGLRVVDDGEGMDAETRRRIFEPFFTTKAGGSGLGMAAIEGATRQAGGAVEVHSGPGEGTTVELFFPRVRARELPTPSEPDEAEGREPAGETVLIVEDGELVRRILRRQLERAGYRVLTAETGPAALALLDAGERVDFLVTDAVLPVLGGPELLRQVARRHPELPALCMSAHPREHLLAELGLPPEVPSLQKPFSGKQLSAALDRLRNRRGPPA